MARHLTAPRFTVVVPAYNEEALLPRLLDSIEVARARCRDGAQSVEVIVADNGSTDRTAALARARGCRVVTVEKRVIGAARNGGARVAAGEILAFVDADSQIHPDTFNEIDRVMANSTVSGGTSGARFERQSLGIACTHALLVLVAMVLGGVSSLRSLHLETGVTFCRRECFIEVGGYREERLFTEDVQFLVDLRRLGRSRGHRIARGTNAPAIFSTRKFDRYGDWHYFTMPLRLAWGALRGEDRVARRYWYQDR